MAKFTKKLKPIRKLFRELKESEVLNPGEYHEVEKALKDLKDANTNGDRRKLFSAVDRIAKVIVNRN